MAINQTRNVIFIDAVGSGVAVGPTVLVRIASVIVVGGAAAGLLKIYAAQSAVAARQIFEGTAPINIAEPYRLQGDSPESGILASDNGLFVDLSAGARAFIYLA